MKFSFIIGFSFLLLSSCGLTDDNRKKDTPTSGTISFLYDEGLTPHINNQIHTFQSTYPNAIVHLMPSDEKNCIEQLFNDSCKIIAISRTLSKKENEQFVAKNIFIETSVVAKTAIAFVVNKNFTDSTLSLAELKQLITGNDSIFIKNEHIKIIFDNQNSGSTRYLKDSLIPDLSFGKNCLASKNTLELLQTISTSTNAIGVCDFSSLSDKDDDQTKKWLKSIKFLAVSITNQGIYYMPDQSNIATSLYPLTKPICIIKRSSDFSLGKGIQTFIAGPIGQLMFLKQGLAPNRQEERVIEVDMSPMN